HCSRSFCLTGKHVLTSYFFPTLLRPTLRSTLFPYTTLFRSPVSALPPAISRLEACPKAISGRTSYHRVRLAFHRYPQLIPGLFRSEEHTSELQSRENLVCRLLLEKKTQQSQQPGAALNSVSV